MSITFEKTIAEIIARFIYHREIMRNELKGITGPFVLICNHECALDAALLLRVFQRPPAIVMSDQFYFTVPFKWLMKNFIMIHKLQFKTKLSDIKQMRDVVQKDGKGLVLFPAGLMSSDGKSIPTPKATGQFLKLLGAPVYAARIYGSYFVQPKWSSRLRPGKTKLDVYRLFSADELKQSPPEVIDKAINQAIGFDAYREQEDLRICYKNADNIEGLENVLYRCPNCGESYTVKVRDHHTIHCVNCGYTERADKYGFLHLVGDTGKEIRYASDWSRKIYQDFKNEIEKDATYALSTLADIQILNREARRYESIGRGKVTLNKESFRIESVPEGKFLIETSITGMSSLPFKPGKYFDVQTENEIYRCFPDQGSISVQFVHMTEILYDL